MYRGDGRRNEAVERLAALARARRISDEETGWGSSSKIWMRGEAVAGA